MSYIVTGGAGFIGSNMVKKLNEKGIDDVIIIDTYDNAKMQNLKNLHFTDFVDFNDGIPAILKYLDTIENPQGVFHIGANADVLEYDAKKMMMQNYEFSKMYCGYADRNNIPFVYASSSAVYGNSNYQGVDDGNEAPHNTYAWSKWLFDQYTTANAATFSSKVIGFRFFNVFGWGEFHKGKNANIVYRFYRFMKEKGVIDLFNQHIERDHIWVEDVAEVLYKAMHDKGVRSGIYNLGGMHPISHKQVAEIVIRTMISEGVIENSDINNYIQLIDMPEDLRGKFQFHTHSLNQEPFITEIAKGNDGKIETYVKNLIKYNK